MKKSILTFLLIIITILSYNISYAKWVYKDDVSPEEWNRIEENYKRRDHHINSKCINNIKFIDNRDRNLLQLADVCCSSFAQAIKYNTSQEWEYVLKLKSNIWNYKGKFIGYGIKFYPPIEWFDLFPSLIHLIA